MLPRRCVWGKGMIVGGCCGGVSEFEGLVGSEGLRRCMEEHGAVEGRGGVWGCAGCLGE